MLQQINDLYTSAFSGPTPGMLSFKHDFFFDISCVPSDFPEEDSAEDELKAAELHNEEVSDHLSPPI